MSDPGLSGSSTIPAFPLKGSGGTEPRLDGLNSFATLLLAAAILGGAIWVVYGGTLGSPFVFDDSASVLDNPSIVSLFPLVGGPPWGGPLNPPKDLPTSGRPLVNLSLALNYHFGQLNPVGYHFFNLMVHLLSALLLLSIVQRTLCLDYFGGRFARDSKPLAVFVALLWALHPLQTETVVYVTQRTELLVGFFYLGTLYCSLRYWSADSLAGRRAWLTLGVLSNMAGMTCKEVMVSAPLIVLLFDRTFLSGSLRRAWEKSWPLYVGLALGWALLIGLNHDGPRAGTAGFHFGIPAYLWWFTQSKVLLLYLKLTAWPWPLSIHYEIPYLATLGAAWPWLLSVGVLAMATLVLVWRRNSIGFVFAWVLIILSPTLVVPIVTEVAAERRMYLPLAALVTMFIVGGYAVAQQAWGWHGSASGRPTTNRVAIAACSIAAVVMVLMWSVLDLRRLAAYHDALTLWHDTVSNQPSDPLAHNNLAQALTDAGRLEEAIEQCNAALRLKPDFADSYCNLGVALAACGRFEAAIEQYHESIRLKSDNPLAYNNLGNALLRMKQPERALEQYELALQIKPNYGNAHANLAAALANMGRWQEAIEQYQLALQIKPDNYDALANLALAYAALDRRSEATTTAENALRLAKSQGETALADQIDSWLTNYRAQEPHSQNDSH